MAKMVINYAVARRDSNLQIKFHNPLFYIFQ